MPITNGVNLKREGLFTVTFYANNYGINLKRESLFTVTFYANNYWRKFEAAKVIYCDILCQ